MAWKPSQACGLLAAVALVAACAGAAPTPQSTKVTPPPAPALTPTSAPAPRAVIIDTDLGADDLAALAVLLRDPALDVRAITVAGTGLTHCGPGLRTLRNLLADFGTPTVPIGCGREIGGAGAYPFPDEWRMASDAAFGITFAPVPATEAGGEAAAVIAEAIGGSPAPPLVVALGPWTNLADTLAADPALADRISGIHAMGGTLDAPGNVWAGGRALDIRVEFNFAADPPAVAAVLATDVPVTLVPLDATDDVAVTPDFAADLESDHGAAGANLVFELYARSPALAGAGQFLWDQTAALALLAPDVATWEDVRVGVTTTRPDSGGIIRDPAGRPVRAAVAADPPRIRSALLAALRRGAPRAHPFAPVGTLAVTWDGRACAAGSVPVRPGLHEVRLENRTSAPASVTIGGARPPRTWADLVALLPDYDATQAPPDWVIGIAAVSAEANAVGRAYVDVPAGTFGPVCATGELPSLRIIPGAPFDVAP